MNTTRKIAIAALLLLAGCDLLEDGVHLGGPHGRDPHSPGVVAAKDTVLLQGTAVVRDTVIYVTAVAYPEGYDWQRDSASGHVSARIVLFRNGEETVSVPVGDGRASADLDLHHIVDGHLYTEYIGYEGTSLWRDGERVFSTREREYLKGLACQDGVTYTLSCPCGSGGYTLRRDGVAILNRKSACVFGDFADPSYGCCGALSVVAGRVCFASREESGNAVFVVRDGVEERLDFSERLPDVKVLPNGVATVSTREHNLFWDERSRIWLVGPEVWQSGSVTIGTAPELLVADLPDTGRNYALMLAGAAGYLSDKALAGVAWSQSGMVTVAVSGAENKTLEGSWRYISDKCAALSGNLFCLALSSKDPRGRPVVLVGDKRTELPVNGFATEIRMEVE